jgi:signal transduction histidine kinase
MPRQILVRSIRFRLSLWFATILAAVLLAFSGFIYVSQAHDLKNDTLNRLNYKTRKLENSLKYHTQEIFEQKRSLLPEGAQDEGYLIGEDDILALIGLDGQVVQKVGPIADLNIQQLVEIGVNKGITQNPFSYAVVEAPTQDRLIRENYLFVVTPVKANREIIGSMILGSPVDPAGQLDRLLFTLILGNLATLGLALIGGYWLADRAMRPVNMITRTARDIGETDLSRRIHLGTQDELGELADTFDKMLGRLQAAFDRQRQFTADASHELRTPLTIVNLETNRALATRRTLPEYERALAVIQAENDLMTRLVNNLLTLSRMESGQAVFAREELDLSDVALEVVERLAPLAERRGVKLSTGELPEVKVTGDRQYLSQMVANLVENGIKYSRGLEAWVRVDTGFVPGGPSGSGARGWVQVTDNGTGIAPEHLGRVFDRFYQVDQARSRDVEELENELANSQVSAGSGLGLSIVQRIAHAHGGEVRVQSELNQGSVFTVWLPLVHPPGQARARYSK